MIQTKELFKIFKEGRVIKISDRMYQVDGKIVSCQTKQGRSILTCSCHNHTKFCNSNAFCFHKESMITYPIFNYYQDGIDSVISYLKFSKGKVDPNEVITLLDNVRRFKNGERR